MDIKPVSQASDDQEIAKVLAGVNEQIEKDQATGLHFEESAAPTAADPAVAAIPPVPPLSSDTSATLPPVPAVAATPAVPASVVPTDPIATPLDPTAQADPALEGIKQEALGELRPLVDKLNVSSEEKFDTYLLLLRSTDDKSLIAPAHDAAKNIEDEARRAQALLDIIKEIDFLSHKED